MKTRSESNPDSSGQGGAQPQGCSPLFFEIYSARKAADKNKKSDPKVAKEERKDSFSFLHDAFTKVESVEPSLVSSFITQCIPCFTFPWKFCARRNPWGIEGAIPKIWQNSMVMGEIGANMCYINALCM
jgi:hypothetical protein